jgi:hypothetical protein
MQNLTTSLFWAAANQMSQNQKVFVLSADEGKCLDLLDAGAKEVVLLGEDQEIEGVKVRSNYRERPNSKDIVIDPQGIASLEDVTRILKKRGFYLTAVVRDWSEFFDLDFAVQPQAQSLNLLVVGDGTEMVGGIPQEIEGETTLVDPIFYLAATHALPVLPDLKMIITATNEQISLSVHEAVINENKALKKTIKSNEKSHEKTHEKTQEKLSNAQRDLKNLKRQHKNLQKKTDLLTDIEDNFQELSESYQLLTENNKQQENTLNKAHKRHEKLEVKHQDLRTKSRDIKNENKELSKELKLANRDLQKLKHELAKQADHQAAKEQAQTQVVETQACYQHIAEAWRTWVQKGFDNDLPVVPPAQSSLVENWSEALLACQPLVSSSSEDYNELINLRQKSQEGEVFKTLLKSERDQARTQVSHMRTLIGSQDESLQQALEAEQALRKATEVRLQEQDARSEAYEGEIQDLQNHIDELQRQRSLAQAHYIDPNQELQARLAVQSEQQRAFENILHVHQQLQSQLTQALSQEISARAQAEYQQRLTEEELRSLRAHIQYPLPSQTRSTDEATGPSVSLAKKSDVVVPTAIMSEQSKQRLGHLSQRIKQKAYQKQSQSMTHALPQASTNIELPTKKLSDHDIQRIARTKDKLKRNAKQNSARTDHSSIPVATTKESKDNSDPEKLKQKDSQQRAKNVLKDRLKNLSRKN